ncbi:MAG TPA: FtsX-like permease family protein, partial [Gemmatimonadales bacterium]
LQNSTPDLVTALRNATGKHSGGRKASLFRASLVTAQIALSLALLSTAGLFIKSLGNVGRVNLGLTADNVVTFGISPKLSGYASERSRALFVQAEAALAAIPGVTGVTSSAIPLLTGDDSGNGLTVEGYPKGTGGPNNAWTNEVGPGYFRVLRIPLLAGREFAASDGVDRPKVAIVNDAFARKFHLGANPVGKRFTEGQDGPLDIEIVGVVRNAAYSDVKDTIRPIYYTPYLQDPQNGTVNVYVRTASGTAELERTIPSVIARLDPNLPVEDLKTLPQQVRENAALDRMVSSMSGAFAALATLLAAVGLYGVLAYSVAQRTREIGVRQALGATARDIRVMVLRQVGTLTVIGGTAGLIAAVGLGQVAKSLLYQLNSTDPVVLTLAAVTIGIVAALAGYIPASSAARVAPTEALREQ